MESERDLSYEGKDALAQWVRAHCPCALEAPDFLRGLFRIVGDEIRSAREMGRQDAVRALADGASRN